MKITLDYGKTGLDVTLPDDRLIAPPLAIRAGRAAARPGRRARTRRSQTPIGTKPLAELAQGQEDRLHRRLRHHPAGAEHAHPAARAAHARGGRRAATGITILIATGLHRPNEGDGTGRTGRRGGRRELPLREPPRQGDRGARLPRHDAQRRAGVDRQPLHPRRPEDHDRPDRAAPDGRLLAAGGR